MADDGEQIGSKSSANGGSAPANTSPNAAVRTWGRWTIAVSAPLALLVSLVLLAADAFAGVLNNLGGAPRSAGSWLGIAAAGHGALALASAVLFGVGMANATRRRAATLAAWAIIPVGIGWLFLLGRLAAG